jgi:hypothetical protein
MWAHKLAGWCCVAALSGCPFAGPERPANVASPLPPPRAALPTNSLPADLDVAVRLDLPQLVAELGSPLTERILTELLLGADTAAVGPLLSKALAGSELLWLGWRANDPIDRAEKVLFLRGRLAEPIRAATEDPAWSRTESIDSEQRTFVRATTQPGALVKIMAFEEQLLVWASAAEVPSVERLLSQPAQVEGLHPPDRGTLSLAANPERVRQALSARYPRLASHFGGARSLSGYIDPSAHVLNVELDLRFETPGQAEDAGTVVERLRQQLATNPCAVGVAARSATVTPFARSLRILAEFEPQQVEQLKACLFAAECCA